MSEQAERFRRAADGFQARVEAVPADRWEAPTPCPDWTARDVVAHVINEARRVLATVRGLEPEQVYGVPVADMGKLPQVRPDADLAAAWARISAGMTVAIDDPDCLKVALPTPVGPLPFKDSLEALPEDVLIHTWDLARATGGDEKLDPEVVAHVYEHFKPMDEFLRQPWAFGPKVTPPPDADLQTEFLCFVGRHP
ncbi:TIGR03086 family metal-binding protein [Fodinicola feengrottensis]|nr:TIGR03086 family metal-binding protein [Fodinicola feengrottensis]